MIGALLCHTGTLLVLTFAQQMNSNATAVSITTGPGSVSEIVNANMTRSMNMNNDSGAEANNMTTAENSPMSTTMSPNEGSSLLTFTGHGKNIAFCLKKGRGGS